MSIVYKLCISTSSVRAERKGLCSERGIPEELIAGLGRKLNGDPVVTKLETFGAVLLIDEQIQLAPIVNLIRSVI